ncbi:MAG: polysaccharide deacetylase family protein [Bacillota bacterium]|nr:polysaccharide deacetylase family protein [Bacillota bacterium]
MILMITRRGLLQVLSVLLVTAVLAVSPSILDHASRLDIAAVDPDAKPYYRGPADKPLMSLMVNVDWGDEFILDTLETFARHGVSATWFPTGRWANRTPELLKLIADAGHEIGNHGGWHGMASKMSAAEVERLIREGADAVFQVTGQRTMLFAPPSGDMNEQTVAVAARMGYKTILWTIDTVDWQRPAASVIVDRVVRKAQNGALVLMHPTKPTAEALPTIIRRLREQGFELVTVSRLLGD